MNTFEQKRDQSCIHNKNSQEKQKHKQSLKQIHIITTKTTYSIKVQYKKSIHNLHTSK